MDAHGGVWRIVAVSVLVAGMWGNSVSVGSVYIHGGEFNLSIPDKGWMADAVIDIRDHYTIYDLDVGIDVTHSSIFDLQVFLQSPAGTKVCLNMYDAFWGFFKGANYTQTIFDDEAQISIEESEAPFTGRFRPLMPYKLSQFDGQDSYGCWRLQIYDGFYADSGMLEGFNLTVQNPEPATAILLALGVWLMFLQNRR